MVAVPMESFEDVEAPPAPADGVRAVARQGTRVALDAVEALVGVVDARRLTRRPDLVRALERRVDLVARLRPAHEAYVRDVSAPDHAVSLETASVLAALLEALRPRRVLDLGSGFSSYVVREFGATDAEIVTVDDAPEWLARTESYLDAQGMRRGTFRGLDVLQERDQRPFDLVFDDLGHMATRCRTLPSVVRLVAPDGIAILDDYHKYRYGRLVRACAAVEGARVLSLRSMTRDGLGRCAALWFPGSSTTWEPWE